MRVLVPHDGSARADAATRDLSRSGLPATGELLVLSVADGPAADDVELPSGPLGRHGRSRAWFALDDARAAAVRGAAQARALLPRWEVAHDAVRGDPATSVLARAAAWAPDLIVVGCRAPRTDHPVFGSVATTIVVRAEVGVRVVRDAPGADAGARGVRLVVGIDGSPGAAAAVAVAAARCWPPGSAALVVCAVDPDLAAADAAGAPGAVSWRGVRDLVATAVAHLRGAGLDAAGRVVEGEPRRVLAETAAAVGADAIFVGAHGRGSVGRCALVGGVATGILSRTRCSVEVVRSPR